MAITPNPFSIQKNQTVELTSALNNAIWQLVSGGGFFTAGSTGFKKVFNPSVAGSVAVKASTALYAGTPAYTTKSADEILTVTDTTQFEYNLSAALSAVGDYYEFTAFYGFYCGLRTGGNRRAWFQGIGFFDESTGFISGSPAVVDGDIIRFELIAGNKVVIKVNGTLVYTFSPTTYTGATVPFIGTYQTSVGTIIQRPNIGGNGVTGYTQEISAGTVSNVPLSPGTFSISTAQTLEFTSSINNAFWSIVSGGGSFSAGSTGFKKVFNPGAAGAVSLKASSAYWNQIETGLTLDSNQNLIQSATNNHFAYSNARIKNNGDYFQFTVTQVFLDSAAQMFLQVSNSQGTTAYGNFLAASYYAGGSNFSYPSALAVGDVLRFEVTSATAITLKRNGATLKTLNHSETGGFLIGVYSANLAVGQTIAKPVFVGTTGFSEETGSGTVYAPLTITTASPLPNAFAGIAYSLQLTKSGGLGNPVWSPADSSYSSNGASLTSDGVLSFTRNDAVTFTLATKVTDDSGTVTKNLTVTVSPPLIKATVGESIVSVSFFAEDDNRRNFYLGTAYSPPYQIQYISANLPNGNYKIRAEAADAAGNVGVSNLSAVTVSH